MKLLKDKREIVCLLTKVIEKYERENKETLTKNSNRDNYAPIAKLLSNISNNLPYTSKELTHEVYKEYPSQKTLEYPFRKYDVTTNQVKDAYYHQIVSNPKNFLIDACYIYLYGVGRKGFEQNPTDKDLIDNETLAYQGLQENKTSPQLRLQSTQSKSYLSLLLGLLLAVCMGYIFSLRKNLGNLEQMKSDMKLLPYSPTLQEIEQLEGVWICYTGSPQARTSDTARYHLVVPNIVSVQFKNGYFVFDRYGASFNHEGYMQYESPGVLSIHSTIKTGNGTVESPRHSLMLFEKDKKYLNVISSSWNFDVGKKNTIIGIREVYVKQGKGIAKEVINTTQNASCKCKIVKWEQKSKESTFFLKNEPLESLPDIALQKLLDEKSILLRNPTDNLVITHAVPHKHR